MVSFRRSGGAVAEAPEQVAPAPMLPVAMSEAAFPRVNLMPTVIAAEAKVRKAKLLLVAAAVCSVVAVGGLWFAANGEVNAAQERLDDATTATAQLKTEAAKYADVPKVQAQVALSQQQAYLAMGGEVRWSFLLNDLALTIPRGASLTSFVGTITGMPPLATAAKANGSDDDVASVLGTAGIGNIQYEGEARGLPDVAAFLDTLAKQRALVDAYPGVVQKAEGDNAKGLTFQSSVTITQKALSHRYDLKAGN